MSRTYGAKNKIPSKKDLVKYAVETIHLISGYINKYIDYNSLNPQQQQELQIILERSEKVLQVKRKQKWY